MYCLFFYRIFQIIKYTKRGSILIILSFLFTLNNSQTLDSYNIYKKQYPDQTSVVIKDIENIQIDVKNGNYKISTDIEKTYLALQNQNIQSINKQIFYDSEYTKINNLSAYTLVPNDKDFKKIEANNIIDDKASSFIFYDHSRVKLITYSSLQPGAYSVLKYSMDLNYPTLFSGTFSFKETIPKEFSQLTIKVDKKVRLKFKMFFTDSCKIDYRCIENEKYNIHIWTSMKTDPMRTGE